MDKLLSDARALESYLRFSYPLGEGGLFVDTRISCPEIRFASRPERTKEE